jgi:hypothetical protein
VLWCFEESPRSVGRALATARQLGYRVSASA